MLAYLFVRRYYSKIVDNKLPNSSIVVFSRRLLNIFPIYVEPPVGTPVLVLNDFNNLDFTLFEDGCIIIKSQIVAL